MAYNVANTQHFMSLIYLSVIKTRIRVQGIFIFKLGFGKTVFRGAKSDLSKEIWLPERVSNSV